MLGGNVQYMTAPRGGNKIVSQYRDSTEETTLLQLLLAVRR